MHGVLNSFLCVGRKTVGEAHIGYTQSEKNLSENMLKTIFGKKGRVAV
jgi:hypothetical protein